jgi:gas vesicle protein
MGANKSKGVSDTNGYVALPASNGTIRKNYTNSDGKVTSLYGFNTSKTYSAIKTKPVEVNETEWVKNNSQSNNNRNVYRHKTINSKLRMNYKHKNGTKNTLYGFNKNKTYVDPTLKELMKINKDTIKDMIDNFREKFKDNEDVYPVIEQLEQEIQPLMNIDSPTQSEIKATQKRIKEIIHHATVVQPQISQITEPTKVVLKTLGNTVIVMLKILASVPMIGLALLAKGGTRRKTPNRRRRTQRH